MLIEKVCMEWTKSCAPPKKIPNGFVLQIKDEPFNALSEEGLKKLKQLNSFKKMQAKTDMGFGPRIDKLEKDLRNGLWAIRKGKEEGKKKVDKGGVNEEETKDEL